MQQRTVATLCLLLVAAFCVQQSYGQCNVCLENGVACIDDSTFSLCFEGTIDSSKVYSCFPGTSCTSNSAVCVQEAPACAAVMKCGACTGGHLFACMSPTTFAQCNGTTVMSEIFTCPDGQKCDSRGGPICVSEELAPPTTEC